MKDVGYVATEHINRANHRCIYDDYFDDLVCNPVGRLSVQL